MIMPLKKTGIICDKTTEPHCSTAKLKKMNRVTPFIQFKSVTLSDNQLIYYYVNT